MTRPSGILTFFFTDIEGSTRLWAEDEAAMSASLSAHDQLLRSVITDHDGYVFSTAGDSFGAAFTLATAAVAAAAEVQSALDANDWPGHPLRVRIGIHLGEADERDGNYLGPAVNTAARVADAGHGGQTLLTEAVRIAARVTETRDLGMHRLRDVAELVHLHQIGDAEFPALRSGKYTPAAAEPDHDRPRSWLVLRQPGLQPATIELTGELTVGRYVGHDDVDGHLATHGDPTVSRLHAVFVPKPTGWCVQATNTTNGLFVNGSRLGSGAVHLLGRDDEIRLGERTSLTFHTLADGDDRSATETARPIPELTPGERRVLLSLCSPVLAGDAFTPPATVAAIAVELFVTESAVKQQLGRLYEKFDVDEGGDRRVRLANEALACGAVRLADLRSPNG